MLQRLIPLLILLGCLISCGSGGGGGGNSTARGESVSADTATIDIFFKNGADSNPKSLTTITVSFNGDGVFAGFPPGVAIPSWLEISAVSSTSSSATFRVGTPRGLISTQLGVQSTTLRFITGDVKSGKSAYLDIPLTLHVDEIFNATSDRLLELHQFGSSPVTPQTITVHGGDSQWSVSSDVNWLSFDKLSGKGPANITVSIANGALPPGEYSASVIVSEKLTGVKKSLPLSLTVKPLNKGVKVENSQAFTFSFHSTATLAHPTKPLLFISDSTTKRLYVVNTTTGLTEHYFEFDGLTDNMAFNLTADKLYLQLLTQEHSPYYWQEDQSGRIAVLDIASNTIENEFYLSIAPGDLAFISKDRFVVGGGSAQFTSLNEYDAANGQLIQELYRLSPVTHLEYLAAQNVLYIRSNWESPPPIIRFDIAAKTQAKVTSNHGDWYPGNDFWLDAAGAFGITSDGDVFTTQNAAITTRIIEPYTMIQSAVFDAAKTRLVAVVQSADVLDPTRPAKLIEFDTSRWTATKVLSENFVAPDSLLLLNGKIYALRNSAASSSLELVPY